MTPFDYARTQLPIRADLPEAYRAIWMQLGRPGNWFDGKDRLAIAADVVSKR